MAVYLNLALAAVNVVCGLPCVALVNIAAAALLYALQTSADRDEIESARKLREKLLASK